MSLYTNRLLPFDLFSYWEFRICCYFFINLSQLVFQITSLSCCYEARTLNYNIAQHFSQTMNCSFIVGQLGMPIEAFKRSGSIESFRDSQIGMFLSAMTFYFKFSYSNLLYWIFIFFLFFFSFLFKNTFRFSYTNLVYFCPWILA